MSAACKTSPCFELPRQGKGTYVQWTDMSPSPHAQSPLKIAQALSASASLSAAAWCSSPKLVKISNPHGMLTSFISEGDAISSPASRRDVMYNEAHTGEVSYGDTGTSPLARAVSVVASFGLLSWRTSRITKRSIPHGSRAEPRESQSVSSNVWTHEPSSVMPSVGALSHSAGSCKPCAWFWKPNGCANGADCRHCHLCPQDELRRRKKTKAAHLKQMENVHLQENTCGSDSCSVGHEQAGVYIDDFCPAKRDTVVEASVEIAVPNANGGDLCNLTEVAKTSATLASEGSRLHGSGACRPCSWFWKPQGCQYGAECLHCHLCLDGEQRRRKKEKTMVLRAAGVPKNKQIGVQDAGPNF